MQQRIVPTSGIVRTFLLTTAAVLLLLNSKAIHAAIPLPQRQSNILKSSSSSSRRNMEAQAPQQPSSTAWIDGLKSGLASACSAACVKTVLQPIDAIKTIQQYEVVVESAAASIRQTRGLTWMEATQRLIQRPGGIWNLYAGLGVTVVGAMPGVALYFGIYSYCKHRLEETHFGQQHPTLTVALSAAIGNTLASFSRVPHEVLKQQLQTQHYSSTWQAFRTIAASGQWTSLIFPKGGIAIQTLRDVPFSVVTLLVYETLQTAVRKRRTAKDNNNNAVTQSSSRLWNFAIGGMAGGLGAWVTNPMDVIKTRLQTNSAEYQGSIWTCTKAIYQQGGLAAFGRGSLPRLAHAAPANAIFFVFYEIFRRLLGVQDKTIVVVKEKNER